MSSLLHSHALQQRELHSFYTLLLTCILVCAKRNEWVIAVCSHPCHSIDQLILNFQDDEKRSTLDPKQPDKNSKTARLSKWNSPIFGYFCLNLQTFLRYDQIFPLHMVRVTTVNAVMLRPLPSMSHNIIIIIINDVICTHELTYSDLNKGWPRDFPKLLQYEP